MHYQTQKRHNMASEQLSTTSSSISLDIPFEEDSFVLIGEFDGVFCYENKAKQIRIQTRVKDDLLHGIQEDLRPVESIPHNQNPHITAPRGNLVILGPLRYENTYVHPHLSQTITGDEEWS